MSDHSMHNLQPGLMVIHGNHPEDLRDVLMAWMQRYPLRPLENETVLVQSNGIAQWLKLSLAKHPSQGGCGVTAAVEVQLPAQFLWQAYRAVLGRDEVPEVSPLDKQPLTWRLMRLLPALLQQAHFEGLHRFLRNDDDQRKRYQLAERIADLFDQYQVYRADWLAAWAAGRDVVINARGQELALDEGQRWQAALWRTLLVDVGEQGMDSSRANVHRRFMQRMRETGGAPGLPRRVIIFGISSMPAQTLEALAALSQASQVLLCVHNPCRHHWSDIVADKDLLRHRYKRQGRRANLLEMSDEDLHQHAHPLLAAWGKQGRDYIHLVDAFDNPDAYARMFDAVNGGRLDLFSEDDPRHMLGQLQDDILDLRPLPESRAHWPQWQPHADTSIRFQQAHSPQREVEVLHDQLLARLDADPTLKPRDIIVMVPDVNVYAPHIEAVFGRIARSDRRYIPYTVADQGQRGREPLLVALEHVLNMPESRFTVSEILDLLAVPALRARFGVGDDQVPLLHRWIEGAGVRWGLNAAQRAGMGLPEAGDINTWQFGLRRMLLGFAVGQGQAVEGIEPYDEIGGLDAAALGPLAALLRALAGACTQLATPATPRDWVARLRTLLEQFFAPSDERESMLQAQLLQGLDRWLTQCTHAAFDEAVPLTVVREMWLAGMDQASLQQRFMAGAVSFCSLMPMRAIPFKVVCLLGMNDGAYPRPVSALDFDLMRNDYRPGDRSRRDDDRYLLLEAVLSARDQLYVSWVGRSIRDSSPRPPSVLVGQLRDHLSAGWRLAGYASESAADKPATQAERAAVLAAMTTEHPLQPFSPRYFAHASHAGGGRSADGLYTYAQEWHEVHGSAQHVAAAAEAEPAAPLAAPVLDAPIGLRQLQDFMVQPVAAFFRQRLKVFFDKEELTSQDDELFAPNGLQAWQLQNQLLASLQPWVREQGGAAPADELATRVQAVSAQLRREGKLPLRDFADVALQPLEQAAERALTVYAQALQHWPHAQAEPLELRSTDAATGIQVVDWLRDRRTIHLIAEEAYEPGVSASIYLSNGRLHSGSQLRYDRLIRHWVEHLAWHIAGQPLATVVCSESGIAVFAPLGAHTAATHWHNLLALWQQGMCGPLPLPSKTALAWLDEQVPRYLLPAIYDDSRTGMGEVQRVAELARTYPDYTEFDGNPEFERLARALYQPMMEALSLVNGEYTQGLRKFSHGDDAAGGAA